MCARFFLSLLSIEWLYENILQSFILESHTKITRFLSSPALRQCVYLCRVNLFLDHPYFLIFLQPVEYLQVAEKAANFIKEKLYDTSSKRLHHSYPNGPANAPGFLHDYAFLINGLLDLYQYGGKIEWLMYALIYLVNISVHYIIVVVRFDSIRGLHFMVLSTCKSFT